MWGNALLESEQAGLNLRVCPSAQIADCFQRPVFLLKNGHIRLLVCKGRLLRTVTTGGGELTQTLLLYTRHTPFIPSYRYEYGTISEKF